MREGVYSFDPVQKVTLGVGVCFGEIALLGTGRMNRRTANVRCSPMTNRLCVCLTSQKVIQ